MSGPRPPRSVLLDWQAAGTAFFETTATRLSEADLAAASQLPGWRRAHVIAHVARNADALVNLLTWARTGVETPMYADADARNRDIDRGMEQPAAALLEDLQIANARFDRALAQLPEAAWAATVRTAQGRLVPAAEVPWMRCREVWLHAADLAGPEALEDIPAAVTRALIADALTTMASRSGAPHLRFEESGGGGAWELPGAGPAVTVRGPLPALAGYVLRGRRGAELATDDGAELPPAPRWL